PNKEPRRLLKSCQTSSRSGGPSDFPGRRGGSEPFWFPPPRPQPGSFRLNSFDIGCIVIRGLTELDNCVAQFIEAGALQSAYKDSRNGTMFIAFSPWFVTRFIDFVIDKN